MDYSSGTFCHLYTEEVISLPLKEENVSKSVRLIVYSYLTTNFLFTHISKLSNKDRVHLSEHRLSLLCLRPVLYITPSHLKTKQSRDH
jgi:hypothetical protein